MGGREFEQKFEESLQRCKPADFRPNGLGTDECTHGTTDRIVEEETKDMTMSRVCPPKLLIVVKTASGRQGFRIKQIRKIEHWADGHKEN